MGRWADWVVRRCAWVIAFCGLLTVVALLGVRRLRFSNRMMDWLPKDDPQIARHIAVSDEFSVNNMALILLRPRSGVFRPALLRKVKDLTERLKETPGVSMVTSMANAADIRQVSGGIEVTDLLDVIPDDRQGMEELRGKALGKDTFRNRIVSGDGKWLALSVYIDSASDQIRVLADRIIPEAEKALAGEGECLYTGIPAETHFVNQFVGRDLATLVPTALLLILAILFLSFRSWQGVVFPILVVLVSSIWLFGFIGFLGSPLTIVSPVMPVVIIALGSAYGIHVLNRLILQVAEGKDRPPRESIALGVRLIFVPLVLAGVTDLAGFLTFRSARLSLFADFGVFTAVGLLLAMVVALALVPALAACGDFGRLQRARENPGLNRILDRWGGFIVRRRRLLLALRLVAMAGSACALTLLRLEVSFSKFYPASSPPRRSMEAANAHFAGAYPLTVSLRADRVRTPEALRVLRRLQNFLCSLPRTSQPFAVTDLIEELNLQLNGDYAIPGSGSGVGNLWFFVEGRDELKQLLTADDGEAVIVAKISDPLTSFNKATYARIESFLDGERRRGYVRYDRAALAPEQRRRLHAAQASFLAQEISWLGTRFARAGAAPAPGAGALLASPPRKPPFAEVREAARIVLADYVASEGFDFDLSRSERERFLHSLMAALDEGRGAADLPELMAAWVPPGAYDPQTASDLAATLLYKVGEVERRTLLDELWGRLAPLFPGASDEFEKRARSVLFDLTVDTVVLPGRPAVTAEGGQAARASRTREAGIPARDPGLPPGTPLAVAAIDQTGYPLMLHKMEGFLSASLLQSILLAYFLILSLMTLMRRSLRLGVLSTLPVLFTGVVMFGLLALIGVPLDYATMMIGGVSIGVGIDYAIHFIHGFFSERDAGRGPEEAIRRAVVDKGKAILTNALSVMAGFAVLLLSSLLPLRNFAWAMVCSMFLAALAALTLLPAALLTFPVRPAAAARNGGET